MTRRGWPTSWATSSRTTRRRCAIFAGDLREKLTIENLVSATVDAFDGIDILVNASRQVLTTDPLDPADTSVEMLLEQNMFTALRLSQAVAKRMIARAAEEERRGRWRDRVDRQRLLNRGAAHPSRPDGLFDQRRRAGPGDAQPGRGAGAASHPEVNGVAFGSLMSASLKTSLNATTGLREEIRDCTPMGRIGSAREVTGAVQFLASEGAGFVTGEVITVDGGRTLLDNVTVAAH